MAAIGLRAVVVRFGGRPALDGVTLDIADGEFVAFLGPTGCGKSTLLRVVSGLETVSSGEVLLDGVDVSNVPADQRNLSMVFQKYALYPHLTVYENIAFPLRTGHGRRLRRAEIDARVHDASRMLDLDRVLDHKPDVLSGGERQRVAMARAVVRRSEALLLDEPLSNLDAHVRAQVRSEIRKSHSMLGITTLYVTHDQNEAMALADRIAILDEGRLQQIGTPREVYRDPANAFVAGFVGLPPMTFLPVTVDGDMAILSFGWVRLSHAKANRVSDGEYLAGLRPEEITGDELAGGGRRFLAIPTEMPRAVHPDLRRFEEEVTGGWLHSSFGLRTESTGRFMRQSAGQLYVDAQHLHLFDPGTGVNLTHGIA